MKELKSRYLEFKGQQVADGRQVSLEDIDEIRKEYGLLSKEGIDHDELDSIFSNIDNLEDKIKTQLNALDRFDAISKKEEFKKEGSQGRLSSVSPSDTQQVSHAKLKQVHD